jgi:hypothetical protein
VGLVDSEVSGAVWLLQSNITFESEVAACNLYEPGISLNCCLNLLCTRKRNISLLDVMAKSLSDILLRPI